MRIALVSPYSWSFPGGVTRHIDALAREFIASGHHVRVLAPVDPDDRLTRRLHRRAPDPAPLPEYVVPLGRTAALPMNGAMSRLSVTPQTVLRLRAELRGGDFDVIHVHEPIAPMIGWDACTFDAGAPVVGTFHVYSSGWLPNAIARAIGARRVFNRLHARIAVSEAARWTGERFFGGTYDVVPNGVDLDAAPRGPKPVNDVLKIVFVGREEERKGLPVLLSAFAGLRQHVPVRLEVIGADPEGVEPLLAQVEGGMDGIETLGRVDDEELWRRLHGADVLCAPSLGRRELRHGPDRGVRGRHSGGRVRDRRLPPGGDPRPRRAARASGRPPRTCRGAALAVGRPRAPAEMGAAARARAADFAWPQVAQQVTSVYERAIEAPEPAGRVETMRAKAGLVQGDLTTSRRARRLPSLEPRPVVRARGPPVSSPAPAAWRSPSRRSSASSSPSWRCSAWASTTSSRRSCTRARSGCSIALGLFSTSMLLRSVSWFQILRAALPESPDQKTDDPERAPPSAS